jgi:hypothetical protein
MLVNNTIKLQLTNPIDYNGTYCRDSNIQDVMGLYIYIICITITWGLFLTFAVTMHFESEWNKLKIQKSRLSEDWED